MNAPLRPANLPQATWDALVALGPDARQALYAVLLRQRDETLARSQIETYYPDAGPLRRALYGKHMEFYAAGLVHAERAYVAGNRTGKSHCTCYEAVLHMTSRYPRWWIGRRFHAPVTVWFSGEDAKAVRESLQEKLLGRAGYHGTGLVPGADLVKVTARAGIPDAADAFTVRHATGGVSRGVFKAYEQGRESFQAASVDVVVYDEEPPLAIYTEGLTRTLSTRPGKPSGIVMCAFTPLKGLSATVQQFLPGGRIPETVELRKQAWGW